MTPEKKTTRQGRLGAARAGGRMCGSVVSVLLPGLVMRRIMLLGAAVLVALVIWLYWPHTLQAPPHPYVPKAPDSALSRQDLRELLRELLPLFVIFGLTPFVFGVLARSVWWSVIAAGSIAAVVLSIGLWNLYHQRHDCPSFASNGVNPLPPLSPHCNYLNFVDFSVGILLIVGTPIVFITALVGAIVGIVVGKLRTGRKPPPNPRDAHHGHERADGDADVMRSRASSRRRPARWRGGAADRAGDAASVARIVDVGLARRRR